MAIALELLKLVRATEAYPRKVVDDDRKEGVDSIGVGVSNFVSYADNSVDCVWQRASLIMRAFDAFRRQRWSTAHFEARERAWPTPDGSYLYINKNDLKTYVEHGPIGVYRVDTRGKLKRLKRCPPSATNIDDWVDIDEFE